MMLRRCLLVPIVALAVLVGAAAPANAGPGDQTDNSGDGVNTGSEFVVWSLAYANRGSGGSSPIPCEIRQPVFDEAGNAVLDEDSGETRYEMVPGFIAYSTTLNSQETLRGISDELREGRFIRVECNGPDIIDDNIRTLLRVPFIVDVDSLDLLDVSLAQMGIEEPPISTSPGNGQPQLVNLKTWLWVDGGYWQPRTLTATAAIEDIVTITATLTAQPQEIIWDMGDGGSETCTGPGVAYDGSRPASAQSTDCSYTYRRSSAGRAGGAYPMTATVTWGGSYTLSIGGGGDLGTIDVTSDAVPVRVAESQALVDD